MGNVYWYYFDSKGQPYYGTDVSDSDDDETLEAKFRRLEKDGKTETYLFNEYGNPVYGLRKVRRSNGDVTSMYFGTQQECCLQKGDRNITDAEGNSYTFHLTAARATATLASRTESFLLHGTAPEGHRFQLCLLYGKRYDLSGKQERQHGKNYNSKKEEADFSSQTHRDLDGGRL